MNINNPQFQFNSTEWNDRLNYYVEGESYPNGFYGTALRNVTFLIESMKDLLKVSTADIISLLSGTDNDNIRKCKPSKKYFINQHSHFTPAYCRDYILASKTFNERLVKIMTFICVYKAHKAFMAGRRFSAFDAHGDADAVRKSYQFYFDNENDNDWTMFREYIIEVAKTLDK